MTKLLFWNLNRKPLTQLIRQLLDEHTPDVVILAECIIPLAALLVGVNQGGRTVYLAPPNDSAKLVFLSRLPPEDFRSVSDAGGVAIRRVKSPLAEKDLLVVAVHLSSKLHLDAADQAALAGRLPEQIARAERTAGHQRTIVIGDLNMDPFESGVSSSEALHGVMDRRLAGRGTRTVLGEDRTFFYNPMWGRLGDTTLGPSGTYYYAGSAPLAHHWHTFDQVLIRPDLVPAFSDSNLHVLTAAGVTSLLTAAGLPDKAVASDHFPLLFSI